MKHSDWKDWVIVGLYFLVMLFALLSHSFGEEQELTAQDIKVIHNINRALARSPLKDHGYWIVLYSKKYKQNPYLIFAIMPFSRLAQLIRPPIRIIGGSSARPDSIGEAGANSRVAKRLPA